MEQKRRTIARTLDFTKVDNERFAATMQAHENFLRAAWTDPGVRRILSLMAPAVLGVGVAQLSLMINTQIASYLAPGSVTWLF